MKARDSHKISLLLVDDHKCMLLGLSRLLGEEDGFKIAGTASCIAEAEEQLAKVKPDVLVLDLKLGENESGFTFVKRAKEMRPSVKTVVFSTYDDEIYRRHAEELGVDAYVAKGADIAVLKEEIRRVACEHTGACGHVLCSAMKTLSHAEAQILRYMAQGMSQKEVAGEIGIAPSTVATHVQRAKEKLGARSIFQMMSLARLIPVAVKEEE